MCNLCGVTERKAREHMAQGALWVRRFTGRTFFRHGEYMRECTVELVASTTGKKIPGIGITAYRRMRQDLQPLFYPSSGEGVYGLRGIDYGVKL